MGAHRTSRALATNPRAKRTEDSEMVGCRGHLQEGGDFFHANTWEAGAVRPPLIGAVGVKYSNLDGGAVIEPEFGNSKGGGERDPIEDAAADLDFDKQVGRRVLSENDLGLTAHARLVGDPVALVGLQATIKIVTPECQIAAQE